MAGPDTSRHPAAEAGVFLGTFALIFLAMGALFGFDVFLASLERAERRNEARSLYEEAMSLEARRHGPQAVDRLQAAVATERGNPVYQRALAAALLGTGRVAEARAVVAARLEHEPTDGAASLLMARALVREGRPREAVSYYHRAIYGQWDDQAGDHPVQARFELVDLLARLGARRELLAELLPLQDEAPDDQTTRKRIAKLFLEAGAPARAIEIFRGLLREHGRDAETYAGLGEAEIARGNYLSARADFAAAAGLDPADTAVADRLTLVRRVIALDPTQRGLSGEEQYRRSVALLDITYRSAADCIGSAALTSNGPLLDSARVAIATRAPIAGRPEAIDANLDLAERLWTLRRRACPAALAEAEEPVPLVLERISQ